MDSALVNGPPSSLAATTPGGCLRLSPRSSAAWSAKKPNEQFSAIGTLADAHTPSTLVGVLVGESRLAVWSPIGDLKRIKSAPEKGLGDAASTMACQGLHTALFLTRRGHAGLGFVLLKHDAVDPSRLDGKPQDFSEGVQRALMTARHGTPGKKADKTTAYSVRHTRLAVYESGQVVIAALVQDTATGETVLVVGDLTRSAWRAWPVSAAFARCPCVVLPARGDDASFTVRVVRAEVAAPVNRRLAVAAPSLPLALSVFDNVTTAVDDDADTTAAQAATTASTAASTSRCLLVLEEVFHWSWSGGAGAEPASTQRCFQSQCFPEASAGGAVPCADVWAADAAPCARGAGEPLLNVLVRLHPGSSAHGTNCFLQLHHTFGGQELVCSGGCHPVPPPSDDGAPISTTALAVAPCPSRADGTQLMVVLTAASSLWACEEAGEVMPVLVTSGGEPPSPRLTLAAPPSSSSEVSRKALKKSSGAVPPGPTAAPPVAAASVGARLIGLGDGGLACVTDRVCAVFSVDEVRFAKPRVPSHRGAADGSVESTTLAQVAACTRVLTEASAGASALPPHALATILFRDVLPNVSAIGAAEEEVRLVQACYQSFLSLARCETEEEWLYLWSLTTVLQRFLAHRSQAHSVCYTDRFFLDLAERQRRHSATGGSAATAAQKHKAADMRHHAVRAVLSGELQKAQQAKPAPLADEMQYILEGLVAGATTPLLPFAEEVVRRYVETSALSNGACVVRAKPGLASCVHVVGAALVAACLDLPIYVHGAAAQPQGLLWSTAQPSECTSVYVVPQAFRHRQEFERALVLSADMLSIASADETFRPDLVFLILTLCRRDHCLSAVAHLYGPLLKAEMGKCAPLANHTLWMQECTALVDADATPESLVASVFAGEARVNVSSALFYAQFRDGQLNDALFHSLSALLSEEYAAVVLVLMASVATGRLVQAQQRATALAASTSDAALFTSSAREQLSVACATAARTWAEVGRYLPYSFADLSASYAVSLTQSLRSPTSSDAGRGDVSEGTTVALRAAVMCFRLTAVVSYAAALEAKLADIAAASVVVPPVAELHEHADLVQDMLDALRIAVLLGGPGGTSAWPSAHIHTLFLRAVRNYGSAIASVYPEWTPFFRRVLEAAASTTACPGSEAVAAAFAQASAVLTDPGTAHERDDSAFAQAQRCGAQAEAIATHLLAPADAPHPRTRPFVFAAAVDASVPQWPWLAPTPECAAPPTPGLTDWVNDVWRLEEKAEMVTSLSAHTLQRLAAASPTDASPPPRRAAAALPPTFLQPMYGAVCQLLPPVRAYATVDAVPPRDALAARSPGLTAPPPVTRLLPPPPAAEEEKERTAAAVVVPRVAKPLLEAPSSTPAPAPAVAPARPFAASAAVPSKDAPRTGTFSPATVAWWETDHNASHQTATTFDVSDASSSSSSATSYTTATTTATSARTDRQSRPKPTRKEASSRGQRASSGPECGRCGHCVCHHHQQPRPQTRNGGDGDSEEDVGARARRDRQIGSGGKRTRQSAARGRGVEDDDVRVLGPLGAALAPRDAWRSPSRFSPSAASADAPRAQLLAFTRQLRAPEAPRACSARAPPTAASSHAVMPPPQHAGLLRVMPAPDARHPQSARGVGSGGALVPPLLTFAKSTAGSTAEGRQPRLEHGLLDARGLQPPLEPWMARPHDSRRTSPFLRTATAQASRRYMDPPPLPPSAVYVEPPSLLHLRGASSAAATAPPMAASTVPHDGWSPSCPGPTEPASPPYSTFASSALAASAPGAVVLSFDAHGVHQVHDPVHGAAHMSPPSESHQPPPAPPAPPLPTAAATLPMPSLPQPALNPTELTDFRRYTDELVAANRAAAEQARRTATAAMTPPVSSPIVTPTATATAARIHESSADAAWAAPPAHPLDTLQRESDFLAQAQKIMAQREKDNDRFYERVTDSVRAMSNAMEKARQDRPGLQPAEQSELLRSSIRQKNELLNLNRELLDLQVAAARGGDPDAYRGPGSAAAGHSPLRAPQFSVSTSTTVPDVAFSGTQTSPHRPSMQDGSTMTAARTASDPASAPAKTMDDTFADLRRLNAQLLNMNTSAEAMDKAIHETRDAIKRYEALSSVETMNADGLALMHALQHRTAAVEQRLSSLPRPYAPAEAAAPARAATPTSRWRSSSTVFTPYDTTTTTTTAVVGGEGSGDRRLSASDATAAPTSARPRFTSTTVTTSDADVVPSADAAHTKTQRRGTQPPPPPPPPPLQPLPPAPETAAGRTELPGTPDVAPWMRAGDQRAAPPSEDSSTPRVPLGFSVGGGRAEIVSLEALLEDGGDPVHHDRQRSVTFSEFPAHRRAASVGRRSTAAEKERSPSPTVRPPRASATPAHHHTAAAAPTPSRTVASPAAIGSAPPRIYTTPLDLMHVYRAAPKHPREATMTTATPASRRPSMHTAPVLSTADTALGSSRGELPPRAPPRRQTLHTHAGKAPHRSASTTAAVGTGRFAMYAPAAATRPPSQQRKARPARLDTRSLAMPADTDTDRLSLHSPVTHQTQAHASTVQDKYTTRREDRRSQSINQRIAMLEREFQ